MKICMLSNLFPPIFTGSSTHCLGLSRELVKAGNQVEVITARVDPKWPSYEEIQGVAVHRLPCRRLPQTSFSMNFPWLNYTFTPANLHRIQRIVRRFNPRVLHLHNHMFDLGFAAVKLKKKMGLPLVVTIHTMIKHSNPVYNAVLLPLDRVLLRTAIINQADRLIAPDATSSEYVQQAFGRRDSVLIPYGIELPRAVDQNQARAEARRLGLDSRRLVLSVGHLTNFRTREDLIRAMPMVKERFPDVVLAIVGQVGYEPSVELVHELGMSDSIIFTGPLDHSRVTALLGAGELEVHWLDQGRPEKGSLGIASLEAMCAGLPIITASRIDNFGPDVLVHGENLVHVRPGDPRGLAREINALLSDRSRAAEIGRRAARTIKENFSWERIQDRTMQLYDSLPRPVTAGLGR